MSEWISVKDRLPEVGVDKKFPHASAKVIVCVNGKVEIGYYEDVWVNGFTDEIYPNHRKVSHWQPLPSPPKSE